MTIALAKAVSGRTARPWPARIRVAGARLLDLVAHMRQAAVERRELLALNERDLRDIGISRVDAIRVAARPLWRRQR